MSEYLDLFSIKRTKTILNQMENFYYNLKDNDGKIGIWIFYLHKI